MAQERKNNQNYLEEVLNMSGPEESFRACLDEYVRLSEKGLADFDFIVRDGHGYLGMRDNPEVLAEDPERGFSCLENILKRLEKVRESLDNLCELAKAEKMIAKFISK